MTYPIDVMVLNHCPEEFVSWSAAAKLARYEKVMKWHDFMLDLNKKKKVPWAWGSHQLLSKFRPLSAMNTLITVYHASSMSEYSDMMEADPLRDCSTYMTIPLEPLQYDLSNDAASAEMAAPGDSSLSRLAVDLYRAVTRKPPSFFDPKNQTAPNPPNPPINLTAKSKPGDDLEYLLYGIGIPQSTDWNDARRSVYNEQLAWWHAYASKLIAAGQVRHGWSTHNFCDVAIASANSKGSAMVVTAPTFAALDQLYDLNPFENQGLFLSVLLRPLADQREADLARLHAANR
jgi:hypothetical protein